MRLITTLLVLLFATSAFAQSDTFNEAVRDRVADTGGGVTSGVPFIHDEDISCSEPNCTITTTPGPAGPESLSLCEDTDFELGGNPDCLTWTAPISLPSDGAEIALGKFTSLLNALTSDFPNGAWWGTEVLYTPLLPIPVNVTVDIEVAVVIYAKATGFPGPGFRYMGFRPYVQQTGVSARYTYLTDVPFTCAVYLHSNADTGIQTCRFQGVTVPDNVNGDDLMELGFEVTNQDSAVLNFKLYGSAGKVAPGDVPGSPGAGTSGLGNADTTWSYTIRN